MDGSRGMGEELTQAEIDRAFRHGLYARERFADRPFDEVESWLEQSWEGSRTGAEAEWDAVRAVVRSGYERGKGAPLETSTEPPEQALEQFEQRNVSGSRTEGRSR